MYGTFGEAPFLLFSAFSIEEGKISLGNDIWSDFYQKKISLVNRSFAGWGEGGLKFGEIHCSYQMEND